MVGTTTDKKDEADTAGDAGTVTPNTHARPARGNGDELRTWYEDSLNLMETGRPERGRPYAQDRVDRVERPQLGILLLARDGREIWGFGQTETCRHFAMMPRGETAERQVVQTHTFDDTIVMVSQLSGVTRVVCLNHVFLLKMLNEIFPDAELSRAELLLLVQMVCGLSLREAAARDGVAYETKRSQLKSLSAKTGMNTQSEVVRITLSSLMSYVLDAFGTRPQKESKSTLGEAAFLELYYPGVFRFHEISMGKGRVLRVADAGPIGGKPVVFTHSQTLPRPGQLSGEWLEESGTRLLIPLRHGFLQGDAAPLPSREHVRRSAEDIADTVRLFCNGSARLVMNSTGIAYGLDTVRTHPELIEDCVIAAAAYLGNHGSGRVNRFVAAIQKLAINNNFILEKTYDKYLKRMSTPEGFRGLLQQSYGESKPDMEIFEQITSNPVEYSWLFETYRLSRWSVVRDIAMGNSDIWTGLDGIGCRVTLVHGRQDPINPVASARVVGKKFPNAHFVELPDDGQSLFLSRLKELVTSSAGDWERR
jgi:pimeloyl-ACP methyl ester carboxylesterase/DNA-binding CsgD family transcriptional regulator